MANFNNRITQPYAIRKIFYGVIALIGALLIGFGIADAAQIDQWQEAAERFLAPLLMVISSTLASSKANAGSDQKPAQTETKPAPAQQPAPPASEAGNELLKQLRDQIKSNRN